MRISIGSNIFHDVQIPVLWGSRAILQDPKVRFSVIDLSSGIARLEVLMNEPAPGAAYLPIEGGFKVLEQDQALYAFFPSERMFESISLDLPSIVLGPNETRIGQGIVMRNNLMSNVAVGIRIDEQGIAMGAPLPEKLARLVS